MCTFIFFANAHKLISFCKNCFLPKTKITSLD